MGINVMTAASLSVIAHGPNLVVLALRVRPP